MTPRGIRNNNPCNLRDNGDTWVGKTGTDDDGFCIFDTPAHGIRAACLCLREYQYDHRLFSIGAMIRRYAPASENDTEAYIRNVCLACGAKPDQVYPLTPVNMTPMIAAMIRQECGDNKHQPWYTLPEIRAGVDMAFA